MSWARILVVDDDAVIVDTLSRALGMEGFAVVSAGDGTTALRMAGDDRALSAIVLDVGLPDVNGRAVAARLRAGGVATPILILSALDQVDERIAGLEAGADDYLVKPFAVDELVARIRALLRRGALASEIGARPVDAPFRLGSLFLDGSAGQATWDGRELQLTRREFELLEALARNAEVVMGRDRLLELVWGYDFPLETKVVDVFVAQLRRKLADAGAPKVIDTVRGLGFVFRRA